MAEPASGMGRASAYPAALTLSIFAYTEFYGVPRIAPASCGGLPPGKLLHQGSLLTAFFAPAGVYPM